MSEMSGSSGISRGRHGPGGRLHLLCGDRAWRRAACMSGLVALIAGLGLTFAACGSSAGIAVGASCACRHPAFRPHSGSRGHNGRFLRAPNRKRFWGAVVVDGVYGETFGQ